MYDVAIIGSGPGGYAAAVRLADLGKKVSIIEKLLPGGTCLNWGCIPTKAIVKSTDILRDLKRSSEFGIDSTFNGVDMKAIIKRKEAVVSNLRSGMSALLKSKGIDLIIGQAEFETNKTLKVNDQIIEAKEIIIATGSTPIEFDKIAFDHEYILSSEDMLDIKAIPKTLIVIGGGFIGCEFASIFNALGSKVTIVELTSQILPNSDREIARRLESNFKRNNINIIKGKKVVSASSSNGALIKLDTGEQLRAEKALLCVGRRANTEGLSLDKINIETKKNEIVVDKHLRTNINNIYAIGDVIGGYYLAHAATHEGIVAAENIAGKKREVDYSSVPFAVFTHPEIASVGLSEEEAKAIPNDIKVTKFPFAAVSKAHILSETEGLIKLISSAKDGKILGAHIYGPSASELIASLGIAIKNNLTVKDLSDTIIAHPTLSEAIADAAGRA